MKSFLLLITIVLLSVFVSCKKQTLILEPKYIIFTSDSSGVYGKILNTTPDKFLYSGIPYEVVAGQRILFARNDTTKTIQFNLTVDVGKYNYFSPNNQYHYRLTNQYVIIIPN